MPLFPNGPVIMGHEFAGVVIEDGEGVEDIKVESVGVNPMDRETKVTVSYNYDGGYAKSACSAHHASKFLMACPLWNCLLQRYRSHLVLSCYFQLDKRRRVQS